MQDTGIALRLRIRRETLGLSLHEAAWRVEIAPEILQDIERGVFDIPPKLLIVFGRVYDCQMSDLLREPPVFTNDDAILQALVEEKMTEGYAAYCLHIDRLTLREREIAYRLLHKKKEEEND